MMESLIFAGVALVAILGIGIVLAKLYRKASSSIAFVRTGMGGQKVILNGGCVVLPIFHDTIPVNLETLKLEVERQGSDSLFTKDRLRMDVKVAFFVRVKPVEESIANAARTLGNRTLNPNELSKLVEEKFVDALRAAAISMTMQELMDRRQDFIQAVQNAVNEDLQKNGLGLESVSLTRIDQTPMKYFDPTNALDAEGLTRLTEQTQLRLKERNKIEQETSVEIAEKNYQASQQKLQIERNQQFANLEQEREVSNRTAEQNAEVARISAEKHQEAESARITAERTVQEAEVQRDLSVKQKKIDAERELSINQISSEKARRIAEQEQAIAIAEKSEAQSQAEAKANNAKASAVTAAQAVITAESVAEAEREKEVALVVARQDAEKKAIGVTVFAEAEAKAAESQAQAIRTKADARAIEYNVEADGKKKINEATNTLSTEQMAMNIRMALIAALPKIIEESVKPMLQIEGIRISQVGGIGAGSNNGGNSSNGGNGNNLAQNVVDAALAYQTQKPLIEQVLREVGLSGDLSALVKGETVSHMMETVLPATVAVETQEDIA